MVSYTVTGTWPFPLDMLRHDQSRAATPVDQEAIERLSGESAPDAESMSKPTSITLVVDHGGRFRPNAERWESFGWSVPDDPYVKTCREYAENEQGREALRRSGLAKLTAEERKALGLS
jgi:hypothetical protein